MTINHTAFERYRRSPNEKTTLLRLVFGTLIVVAFWFGATIAALFGFSSGLRIDGLGDTLSGTGDLVQQFLESAGGIFTTLLSFAGIWIGVWIAMRLLHKEPLSNLFGISARISRSGLLKGFTAVVIASLLTELVYQIVMPGVARGPVALGTWALLILPLTVLAFVQTSAEELLFRGYLQRGLAYRFRSTLVWAVIPTVVFTALHWDPTSQFAMNIGVMITIGAFSALLVLLVYVTGNLGAAMGAHLGNNLVGFALISHDRTLGGLALFQAPPLENLAWTAGETAAIAGISVVSILLTWLLLRHPASPFKVDPDIG